MSGGRIARINSLLAMADLIDETGKVYFVDEAGEVTPVDADRYLAMTTKEIPLGMRVLGRRSDADRASLEIRGIECGPEVQRN